MYHEMEETNQIECILRNVVYCVYYAILHTISPLYNFASLLCNIRKIRSDPEYVKK